jgi:hypothetical protein
MAQRLLLRHVDATFAVSEQLRADLIGELRRRIDLYIGHHHQARALGRKPPAQRSPDSVRAACYHNHFVN